mgnify:CR=1 FL=1
MDYRLSKEDEQQLLGNAQQEEVKVTLWRQSKNYKARKPNQLCLCGCLNTLMSALIFGWCPCSMLGTAAITGIVNSLKLTAAWNDSVYKKFREKHLTGNIPSLSQLCYQ